MPRSVLIVSCPQDTHAHAICEAIERKGVRAHILYTLDFPDRLGLTINPSGEGTRLALHGPARMDLHSTCSSVRLRRTFFPTIPAVFEASDRTIIGRECRKMRESFLELLCSDALWVNSLHGHNAGKPAQLVAASRCGFETPPTLASNEPAEIMAFVQGAPVHVIYKTFNGLVPTTVVTGAMLAEPEILRWTPDIYQHYIAKDHELRPPYASMLISKRRHMPARRRRVPSIIARSILTAIPNEKNPRKRGADGRRVPHLCIACVQSPG